MNNNLSIINLLKKFPDEKTSEDWFIKTRWGKEIKCTKCNSNNITKRKTKITSWRCKDCHKDFSVKTGTVMQNSNLNFKTWITAMYLISTSSKGISSVKLGKYLGITQKSAWHLGMRIRESYKQELKQLKGTVEIDETYIGGKEKNKHKHKKLKLGTGYIGKIGVVAAKQRNGNIIVNVPNKISKQELHKFIQINVKSSSNVITDEFLAYKNLNDYNHQSICHKKGQYVKGELNTNSVESFWALFKRGYYGIYHFMSNKHLEKYVIEFSGRFNAKSLNTENQIINLTKGMIGKKLRYKDLTLNK